MKTLGILINLTYKKSILHANDNECFRSVRTGHLTWLELSRYIWPALNLDVPRNLSNGLGWAIFYSRAVTRQKPS